MKTLTVCWSYLGPVLFLFLIMIACAIVYRITARGDGALRERSSWRNLMLWGVRLLFAISCFATLFCAAPKAGSMLSGWPLFLFLLPFLVIISMIVHLFSPTGKHLRSFLKSLIKRSQGNSRKNNTETAESEPSAQVIIASTNKGDGSTSPEDAERDYGLLMNVVFHTLLLLSVFLGLVAPALFYVVSGNWDNLMIMYGHLSRAFSLISLPICLRETIHYAHCLQNGFDGEKDNQKLRKDIQDRNTEVVSFLSRKCTKI